MSKQQYDLVMAQRDSAQAQVAAHEAILENAVKTPYFVPESVKADILVRNMKTGGKTFAVVLDEYGGMRGILTMNDLIARLVGDFGGEEPAEDGKPAAAIEQIGERTWKLTGSLPLDEIAEAIGVALPEDDYDTFSGMVFSELGSIPDDGESFEIEVSGIFVRVMDVREHQIESAEITVPESAVSDEEDDEE